MEKNLKNKLVVTFLVLVTSLFNFAKAGVTPPPPPPNGAGGPESGSCYTYRYIPNCIIHIGNSFNNLFL
ncbi:hypothetical protein [Halpernia sp. GG3]